MNPVEMQRSLATILHKKTIGWVHYGTGKLVQTERKYLAWKNVRKKAVINNWKVWTVKEQNAPVEFSGLMRGHTLHQHNTQRHTWHQLLHTIIHIIISSTDVICLNEYCVSSIWGSFSWPISVSSALSHLFSFCELYLVDLFLSTVTHQTEKGNINGKNA